jgi:hypothetical protein
MDMIDIDQPATWPPAVMEWASAHARLLRGSTEITQDLEVPADVEEDVRSHLVGHPLVTYHCTRLLDHEIVSVRERGLRMLTRDVIEERIAVAHTRGFLSDGTRDRLMTGNVFARGEQSGREGQVCLVLGRTVFDSAPQDCEPLLSFWGGEGLNGGPLGEDWHLVIGRPSVVVARIDLSVPWQEAMTFPAVARLLVGTLLGTQERRADVHLRSNVAPIDVVDIWQPGHTEYDLHEQLPR